MSTVMMRRGLRLAGYAIVSVSVVIRLCVVLLVTLSELVEDTCCDVDVDRYCEEVVEMLDVWDEVESEAVAVGDYEAVSVDLSVMTWNELRTFAKGAGVTTLKSKKAVLDGLQLLGYDSKPQYRYESAT